MAYDGIMQLLSSCKNFASLVVCSTPTYRVCVRARSQKRIDIRYTIKPSNVKICTLGGLRKSWYPKNYLLIQFFNIHRPLLLFCGSKDIILGYDLLNSHLNSAISRAAALKIGAKRGDSEHVAVVFVVMQILFWLLGPSVKLRDTIEQPS